MRDSVSTMAYTNLLCLVDPKYQQAIVVMLKVSNNPGADGLRVSPVSLQLAFTFHKGCGAWTFEQWQTSCCIGITMDGDKESHVNKRNSWPSWLFEDHSQCCECWLSSVVLLSGVHGESHGKSLPFSFPLLSPLYHHPCPSHTGPFSCLSFLL